MGFSFERQRRHLNYQCIPTKIWADKVNEFCNRSMKLWLQNNEIEMYSTHKERKSIAAKQFIKTLKNKIY